MKHNFKRGIAALMAASVMALTLAGCGGDSGKGTAQTPAAQTTADSGQTQTPKGTGDSQSGETAAAGDGSVIDFDAEPYEVVMEVLNLGQDYPDLPEIEAAINEITLPAINCTLKIQPIHIGDHATKLSLAAAGGDKFDLVYTGTTTSLSSLVSDGVLVPLNDIAATHAPELLAKAGDLAEAGKIDGELYTLPADLYPAAGGAVVYNVDMAKQYGLELPEKITSWRDLEPVAETLAKNGVYLMTPGDGGTGMIMGYCSDIAADFGGDYNYGVIMKNGDTTIENFYETDFFMDYCKMMKEWRDKGYIPADCMTSGENAQDVFKVGKTFCQGIKYTPTEIAGNKNKYDFEVEFIVSREPILSTEFVIQYAWGICITSEQPERAMDMLNLIYTNSDVGNLLMYGLEGKEYEKVSEHIIRMPEGVTPQNTGYSVNFLRAGDFLDMYQWEPNTEDFYTDLPAFQEQAEKSYILGYTFNADPVSTQLAAVTNVVSEYRPGLICGNVDDVDAAVAQFQEKLEQAGILDIIAENQRQLNEWLAANK